MAVRMTAGKGGEFYVPYENRTGCESIVYFTRDLSAAGLQKIYKKVSGVLHGKVAISSAWQSSDQAPHRRAARTEHHSQTLGEEFV